MTKASKLMRDLTQLPAIVGNLGLSIAAAQKAFNADYLENVLRYMQIAADVADAKVNEQQVESILKERIGKKTLTDEQKEKLRQEIRGDLQKAQQQNISTLQKLLQDIAPSRYQFTETELQFRADLAQTFNVGGELGVGVGLGAVSVNASLAIAYGYDYRAAAKVRTVLHAIPAREGVMVQLLGRASELNKDELELPDATDADAQILTHLKSIEKALPNTPATAAEEAEEEK